MTYLLYICRSYLDLACVNIYACTYIYLSPSYFLCHVPHIYSVSESSIFVSYNTILPYIPFSALRFSYCTCMSMFERCWSPQIYSYMVSSILFPILVPLGTYILLQYTTLGNPYFNTSLWASSGDTYAYNMSASSSLCTYVLSCIFSSYCSLNFLHTHLVISIFISLLIVFAVSFL